MIRSDRPGEQREGEGGYLASVSDLMVGLLFLFIILLMAYALQFRAAQQQTDITRETLEARLAAVERGRRNLDQARRQLARERDRLKVERDTLRRVVERLESLRAQRRAMMVRIATLLAEREVRVALAPEKGVLRLPEELLFPLGSAELTPEGRRALTILAQVLALVLPCYAQAPEPAAADCPPEARPILEAVLVEGHTDDLPIHGGPFRDNWELSAARAIHTYRALVADQPLLDLLRNGRGEALLGIAAYEARRPVVPNRDAASRRRNRRIELRFLLAAPDAREVAELRRRVEEESRHGAAGEGKTASPPPVEQDP